MAEDRTAEEIAAAVRKAEAEATVAEHDARRKELELAEWEADGAGRRADAATRRRGAELDNAEAERSAVTDLVPDLGSVDRGSLTVPDSSTVFQALLGAQALEAAAAKIIPVVKGSLGDDYTVLVTTELDVVTRDVNHQSVVERLGALTSAVAAFLEGPPTPEEGEDGAVDGLGFGPAAVAAGAAKLLPGLLSLVSARRSVQNTSSTADDDAVLMCVAGVLARSDPGALVLADRTRLLGTDGPTMVAWRALNDAADGLDETLAQWKAADPADPRLVDGATLSTTCRTAIASLVAVPEKATGSALALSAQQDVLHSGRVRGLLVVKGGAASSTQLVDDRPLMYKDKYNVVSSASISYLLVDLTKGSRVLAGGMLTGSKQAHGEIGNEISGLP